MAKKRKDVMSKRLTFPTKEGYLVVEIVGGRPDSEPYIWIGDGSDGTYLDSIDADGMRLLGAAIADTLGGP